MILKKDVVIKGSDQRDIVIDMTFSEVDDQPVVLFCHGYKGFKDWGAWHLMAEAFAEAGYCFIKFNFSHNGGTKEQPIDFPELTAFGNDNFSKQLYDLDQVINWIGDHFSSDQKINQENLSIIGHSRGGGVVIIKASEDKRIQNVITWASISDIKSRFPQGDELEKWKNEGVYYVENGRTKQQMPHFYQFYEDFLQHQDRLNIKNAIQNIDQPLLLIHGSEDPTVKVDEAYQLKEWQPEAELEIIDKADHVFNTRHPWHEDDLPAEATLLVQKSIGFLSDK
ncbi:MAG: alpha/beta fold hydrolase [Psychroflexus sp.]|nr:alpha/beta fold hydrolase [Psychroflexus sp.]MDR9448750.1 alpha/beta fold hydrolase [Psychroflexus sp.]